MMKPITLQACFLLIIAIWALASPVVAEEAPGGTAEMQPMLQVEDAIREALEANRDLRTAYFAIEQARGRLVQAGLWPNPALDLSGSNDFAFLNEGEYASSSGFEQRFPVAGRIGRAKDVARVDVALALAEVGDATRRLIGEVQSVFYDLLVLNAQIAERDRLVDIARRLVDVSEARVKLAEVSALDVNTARVELQRLELERSLLVAQQRARSAELNRLLGRAPEAPVTVSGEITPPAPPPQATLRSEALRRRPDLQQASLQADRARAERALARADRWEDWTVGFSYIRDRLVVDGAPPQRADQLLGLRLTVPLPLLNRNQGRIAEASSLEAQARSRASALELTVLAEIEAASRRLEEIRQVVEGYRTRLIPLTDRNVALAQDAYRGGLTSVTQVVQVQRQQSEIRTGYLDVLGQYRRASIDLEVASAASPHLETLGGDK